MADEKDNKENELKYYERLNISVLSIAKIKKLLKNDIIDTIVTWQKGRKVDKQCYHIIGPAGVGKTAICYQLAAELTSELFDKHNKENPTDKKEFGIIMVKSPVLSRDDFIIPFPVTNGNDISFKNDTPVTNSKLKTIRFPMWQHILYLVKKGSKLLDLIPCLLSFPLPIDLATVFLDMF